MIILKIIQKKKLLGGVLSLRNKYFTFDGDAHSLSYHICTDEEDYVKIVLCDPNTKCEIIYNRKTMTTKDYDITGVLGWDNIYLYESSFLLINTEYNYKN